jgi:hypothetical protein
MVEALAGRYTAPPWAGFKAGRGYALHGGGATVHRHSPRPWAMSVFADIGG